MPPQRTVPPSKALKTERTHEENQERYVASQVPRCTIILIDFPVPTLLPPEEVTGALKLVWNLREEPLRSTSDGLVAP